MAAACLKVFLVSWWCWSFSASRTHHSVGQLGTRTQAMNSRDVPTDPWILVLFSRASGLIGGARHRDSIGRKGGKSGGPPVRGVRPLTEL